MKQIFERTKNPITWINKYVDSHKLRLAQETAHNSLDSNVGDLGDLLNDF
jgi:hypothetical protein